MNEIDWLKSLDRGGHDVPNIDVAARVMRAVVSHRHDDDAVLPLAALVATLAGAGSVVAALPLWLAANDPLAGVADAFQMVLQ